MDREREIHIDRWTGSHVFSSASLAEQNRHAAAPFSVAPEKIKYTVVQYGGAWASVVVPEVARTDPLIG